MNRPDKAGEPSMEEILASIRQIIADEPSADQPEPAIEANPLVPQSRASKPAEAPAPLADRLSNVLKSGPLPPTSPLGSKRPLSFDQDLADMFDEQEPSNGSVMAPKPDMRVTPGLSHPMATKPFVAPVKEEPKPAAGDGAAALPPQLAPSEPLVPPPPFGRTEEKPAEAAPPSAAPSPQPAPTFGFPPLRKASFYPPQPKAPAAPTTSAANPFSAMSAANPEVPASSAAAPPSAEPQRVDTSVTPTDDLGSVIAGVMGATASNGAHPTPSQPSPFGSTGQAPASASGPDAGRQAPHRTPEAPAPSLGSAPSTPFSTSSPSPAFGASPSFAPAAPAAGRPGLGAANQPFTAPPGAFDALGSRSGATPVPPVEAIVEPPRPAEAPRSYPDPFAQTVRGAPGYASQPRFGSEPMSADAAHQALDALAQGLAASAAHASVSPEPAAPAIPLTPVFEPEPAPAPERSTPSSTLPATVPQAGSMPVNRTLEDAVADMLRPMLQQWVADNMPRIIERALRSEVAKSVKPGNKPPGT